MSAATWGEMGQGLTVSTLAVAEDNAHRARRWRSFIILYCLTCAAVILDLITTYLGFQRIGSRFEQNGIALFLIQRIGWVGISGVLALTCYACLRSFKLVYWNLALKWSLWLNVVLALVCAFRWLVVVSDAAWLIR